MPYVPGSNEVEDVVERVALGAPERADQDSRSRKHQEHRRVHEERNDDQPGNDGRLRPDLTPGRRASWSATVASQAPTLEGHCSLISAAGLACWPRLANFTLL